MIQLIYASAARRHFSEEDLEALLKRARASNSAAGITGMLLYDQGSFLQVLEGEHQVVRRVFEKIQRDPRHESVTLLLELEVSERSFADWSMGFATSKAFDVNTLPGYSEFMRGRSNPPVAMSAKAAQSILCAFKEGRLRRFVDR